MERLENLVGMSVSSIEEEEVEANIYSDNVCVANDRVHQSKRNYEFYSCWRDITIHRYVFHGE
jgi:hypothetical protein